MGRFTSKWVKFYSPLKITMKVDDLDSNQATLKNKGKAIGATWTQKIKDCERPAATPVTDFLKALDLTATLPFFFP